MNTILNFLIRDNSATLGKDRKLIIVISLLAIGLLTFLPEFISTNDPMVQDIQNRLMPPHPGMWFGTDNFGRDVFSRVVFGFRTSVLIALSSVVIGTAMGVTIGSFSLYVGGWVDLLIQRFLDVLLAFPFLLLAVIVMAAFGSSIATVVSAITIGFTPQVARLTRSIVILTWALPHVTAARAIGASRGRILVRHVLPMSFKPVIVFSSGFLSTAIIGEASLSFLGLGVPRTTPSWGTILQDGSQFIEVAPWLVIFPSLVLTGTILSFLILGESLGRGVRIPRVS